jgi:hypothetical protein
LACYRYLKADNAKLAQVVTDYRALWEEGRFRPQMNRFALLVNEAGGDCDAVVGQADRLLKEKGSDEARQWLQLDKARALGRCEKATAARELLLKLTREKSEGSVAPALYTLTQDAISRGHTDDALKYYNLLRDGYPGAVGLDALLEKMGGLTPAPASDTRAEEITGTSYSVQVGVFSVEANARKQAARFEKYGEPVESVGKRISNADYLVVMVGHFRDYREAAKFKDRLQRDCNEIFQVVAR